MASILSIHGLPTTIPFRPAQQVAVALGSRAPHPTGPKTQVYKALWARLAALPVPVNHLELIHGILTLEGFYEGWINNGVAHYIMETPLSGSDIDALRIALPRLPSELNVVLSAHKIQNTCAVTLIPALPHILGLICSLTFDETTAIRLALLNSELNLGSVIAPSIAEMTALRCELTSIPLQLGYGFSISKYKFDKLCFHNPAITSKIDVVSSIGWYEDWFALRNALNFAEGIEMFGAAVSALEDGILKNLYLDFYAHFKAASFRRQN